MRSQLNRLAVLAAMVVCVTTAPTQATKVMLVPVRSTGPYTTFGANGIALSQGAQRVFLEIRVSNWDANLDGAEKLRTLGARLSNEGFSNPMSPSSLRLAQQPCSQSSECTTLFGMNSYCVNASEIPDGCSSSAKCCSPIFVDQGRPDGLQGSALHAIYPQFYFYCRVGDAGENVVDNGSVRYVATVVLDVPETAIGEFTISLRPSEGDLGLDSTFYSFDNQPEQDWRYFEQKEVSSARLFIGVPPKQNHGLRNRYISLLPGISAPGAYAVELVSLHHPSRPAPSVYSPSDLTPFEGQLRWVGPPGVYPMAAAYPEHVFYAAKLQCTPHVINWIPYSAIEVYGDEIIPDSIYRLRRYDASCTDPNNPQCFYFDMGELRTGRWGDIVPPFEVDQPGSQPNISDVAAMVDQHNDYFGAPSKAQCQLHDNSVNPSRLIDAIDISYVVGAFKGLAYPYSGPSQCP